MTGAALCLAAYILARIDDRFEIHSVFLDLAILAALFIGWGWVWFDFTIWAPQ